MLRETKLGLVVASAFVALTTVVVVSRLKQPRAPAPGSTPQVVGATQPKPPPSTSVLVTPATPVPGNPPALFSKVIRADAREMVSGNEKPDLSPTPSGSKANPPVPPLPTTKDGLPDFGPLPTGAGQTPQPNAGAPLPSPGPPAPGSAPPPGQTGTPPTAGAPTPPNGDINHQTPISSPSGGGLPAPPVQGLTNGTSAAEKAPSGSTGFPSPAELGVASAPAQAGSTPAPNAKPLLPLRDQKNPADLVASLPPGATKVELPTPPGPAPGANGNPGTNIPPVVPMPSATKGKEGLDLPAPGAPAPAAPATPASPAGGAPNGLTAGGVPGASTTPPGGPAVPLDLAKQIGPPSPAGGGMTPAQLPAPSGGNNTTPDSMLKGVQPPTPPTPDNRPPSPGPLTNSVPPPAPLAVAQVGAQDNARKNNDPNPPLQPVGVTPRVVSPPVQVPPAAGTSRPAVGGEPALRIYEAQSIPCNAADTSPEAFSERIYGSKRYAQALVSFNREHPRGADELRTDPPQLRAGTIIYVPPLPILEAKYPDLVPGLKPLPPPATAGSVSVGQSSPVAQTDRQPVPAVAVTPPPAAQTPATVPPVRVPTPGNVLPANGVATNGKVYYVPAGGEPLSLIAQQTLGDYRRWHVIYQLNPQLNPEQPVPAGTPVVLPADARVTP